MRFGGYFLALSVSLATLGVAQAQRVLGPMQSAPGASSGPATEVPAAPAAPMAAPAPTAAAPAAAPAPMATAASCKNPNALGVARVVEIDTTGGPGFGFEHFKAYDFLQPMEVVLTFDDGPWPVNTPAVLAALDAQCTKALFFPIGQHSMWHPEILKQVAAAGHTIGSHTWSHQDLSQTKGRFRLSTGKFEVREFDPKEEIEKGLSAVALALGQPPAPFFRFPALRHPPEMVTYLGTRNIGIWSTDMDSFDFKIKKPEQVVASVMSKVKKHGKGIILMHDFQRATAIALPQILAELKAGGYKVVQVKAKGVATTLPEYDAVVLKEANPASANARPMDSVIRTIQ